MVSRSLRVTVESLRVSKSTVMAKGIPHSSVRAYRFPIVWPESSIFDDTPERVSIDSANNVTHDFRLTDVLDKVVQLRVRNQRED